jgi:hypothetical protein
VRRPFGAGLSLGARKEVVEVAIRSKATSYVETMGGHVVDNRNVDPNDGACTRLVAIVERPSKGTTYCVVCLANGVYYDMSVLVADGSAKDLHEKFLQSFKLASLE